MGQLEKYGLYVLCLVIFLILGVTIWGGGELPSPISKPSAAIKAASATTENQVVSRDVSTMPDLTALLRSADRSTQGPDAKKPLDPKRPADPKKSGGTAGDPPSPAKNAGEPRDADARATDPPRSAPAPRPTHKVRNKDTFEGIAKEVLGNAALRTEIARLNAGVDPTKLKLGQELLLPSAAEIAQWNAGKGRPGDPPASTPPKTKEASATPGTYTVVKGDTFERIAAAELGSKKRVHELLELNPTVDPLALKQGQKIKLPKK